MSADREDADVRAIIATASLDEACRMIVSELRSGVLQAQGALAMIRRDGGRQLTDEQRAQLIDIAGAGVDRAVGSIDELLVGVLLRRLEDLVRER